MKESSLRKAAYTVWHVQRIKRLVRDRLGSGLHCVVSVREMICTDPECEGPATEIRVMTLGLQQFSAVTIHKHLSKVTSGDIAVLANDPLGIPAARGDLAG